MALRKPKREPLFDDDAFLVKRQNAHVRKEEPWFRSEPHKTWIRTLPCQMCRRDKGVVAVEAAHLRKGTDGCGGEEPSDFWCWPGCGRCHRGIQHKVGEVTFWTRRLGIIDPHRFILETFALQSPCGRTRDAAIQEWERRYAG